MVDLEITKTELEPQENEWYKVKITFNTNKIMSFFFKETVEITQLNPNSPFMWDGTTSDTIGISPLSEDPNNFDGSQESVDELNKNL